MKEENVTAVIRYMIRLFYEGDKFQKSKYYTNNMICLAPEMTGRTIEKITYRNNWICYNKTDAAFITGRYHLDYRTGNGRKAKVFCYYSALLQYLEETVKLTVLHISERPGMVFCLTDIKERNYFVPEADIFYLEAGHNRVYWHTGKGIIEVTGALLHTENSLPENFVRIHKSFIVNSLHVTKIARCFVELSNGENLQIPVKKYKDVKKTLLDRQSDKTIIIG